MKTTKGGKVMNPTDAYRKELRKKELKRNKKERKKVREVGILKKDPETIKEQIEKLELMKADGALDKARKHKKRQLEDTLNLVMKKRKEYEDKMREKGETPVMFSHLAPPKRWTAAEEEERAKHPKPEDSVYYHPTLNPTGAPPPGKPPMYKSSIGPRIPLGASSSNVASSSISEPEEVNLAFPPPPPPLATSSNLCSVEDSDVPKFIPLPPALPLSPKPDSESSTSFLRPPLPPLPQKEPTRIQSSLLPPPPPGTSQSERENKQNMTSDGQSLKEVDNAGVLLPPPRLPPPSLPPKQADQLSDIEKSEYNSSNTLGTSDISKIPLLPPPPRHPPPPRFPLIPSSQTDVFPPGISRIPPPPADTRPTLSIPGISSRPPHGMLAPPMPMANFAMAQAMPLMGGLVTMMMPSLLPSHSLQEDENAAGVGFPVPHKPSYVKSAESTVVKRPLAQHTPELTAMVPASVRVRRESAAPKAKPKSQLPVSASSSKPLIPPTGVGRSEESWTASSSISKTQSIDDSYTAFLEDMKALGALDG